MIGKKMLNQQLPLKQKVQFIDKETTLPAVALSCTDDVFFTSRAAEK